MYIVSNKNRTVLYTGVTNNIHRRAFEHKNGVGSKFSSRYNCKDLIYWEFHDSIVDAIHREKRIKKWNRAWKEDLIKSMNPEMKDLFDSVEDMQ